MTAPTASLEIWRDWIGLPHEIGADPREGKAACCLRMTWILLSEAGVLLPPFQESWLTLAHAGRWGELEAVFRKHTELLPGPEPWSITMIQNGKAGLGVGVFLPEGYLLLPHHRRGVLAAPLHILRPLQFHRVKP